jgi:hypothetical protein
MMAIDKRRISALHSSRLAAAYSSTPGHTPQAGPTLLASLDLRRFSSAMVERLDLRRFSTVMGVLRRFSSPMVACLD